MIICDEESDESDIDCNDGQCARCKKKASWVELELPDGSDHWLCLHCFKLYEEEFHNFTEIFLNGFLPSKVLKVDKNFALE
jgi:hypothetical protein